MNFSFNKILILGGFIGLCLCNITFIPEIYFGIRLGDIIDLGTYICSLAVVTGFELNYFKNRDIFDLILGGLFLIPVMFTPLLTDALMVFEASTVVGIVNLVDAACIVLFLLIWAYKIKDSSPLAFLALVGMAAIRVLLILIPFRSFIPETGYFILVVAIEIISSAICAFSAYIGEE